MQESASSLPASGRSPSGAPSSRSLGGPSSSPGTSGSSGHSPGHGPKIENTSDLLKVSLAALGVVYGDIGTSPLYAFKECFIGEHGVPVDTANVFGILSLFFWSLTLVVVFKYMTYIMRADNNGEGGILSLLAVLAPRGNVDRRAVGRLSLMLLGLFGAALLYGDGIITPVISVFSAVEGVTVYAPQIGHGPYAVSTTTLVTPVTATILVILFLMQKRGTAGVGALFGPVMLVWFVSIALFGIVGIVKNPSVLAAMNPIHAIRFFAHHKLHGFLALGSVVLCVTGGEALYADMGHFGQRSIRLAWYTLVFPALLLNYFGQGAYLLAHGKGAGTFSPFFQIVPSWAQAPMVVVATLATIVASQALISGGFSLTRQAVQLGYWPRVAIVHTSEDAEGQIYVPEINWMMMVGCLALVLAFRKEGATGLAAAYGIAVTGTMAITSILFGVVVRERWGWSVPKVVSLVGLFLVIDLSFFGANLAKIADGGWIPLVVAVGIFTVMTTWKAGRAALEQFVQSASLPMDLFLGDLQERSLPRVKGTAVFMTGNPDGAPVVLLHHIKHNKVLHEQVVLLSVLTDRVPEVPAQKRVHVKELGQGFFQVIAHYGFMQSPNVPDVIRRCKDAGLKTAEGDISYFLGRETLLTTGKSGLSRWRKLLFGFLSRNARPATSFFGIPPNRVVEMGAQIEL
jgi:KUP system potassium uptake protein